MGVRPRHERAGASRRPARPTLWTASAKPCSSKALHTRLLHPRHDIGSPRPLPRKRARRAGLGPARRSPTPRRSDQQRPSRPPQCKEATIGAVVVREYEIFGRAKSCTASYKPRTSPASTSGVPLGHRFGCTPVRDTSRRGGFCRDPNPRAASLVSAAGLRSGVAWRRTSSTGAKAETTKLNGATTLCAVPAASFPHRPHGQRVFPHRNRHPQFRAKLQPHCTHGVVQGRVLALLSAGTHPIARQLDAVNRANGALAAMLAMASAMAMRAGRGAIHQSQSGVRSPMAMADPRIAAERSDRSERNPRPAPDRDQPSDREPPSQ